jgi:hypothetical protein
LFKNNYKILNRFFLFVVGFTVIGLLIHLALGIKFNQWVGISAFARPDIRYVGFFTHPNHLAYLMVLYVGYLLNNKYKLSHSLKLKDWSKIVLCFVAIVLADSRTAILTIVILLFAFYWKLIKKNAQLIFGGIILGFLIILYTYFYTELLNSIVKNINQSLDLSSHYIRGNMIYLSGLIFIDYFPFGTGAGTFGSVLSDDSVFEIYGQANRYYFKNEIGIYDSNIASIVGEYGFLGIIFFFLMFYYLIIHLKSITEFKTLTVPFIFVFLFYAITNPMLTNNLYTILTSIVLVLFIINHSHKTTNHHIE